MKSYEGISKRNLIEFKKSVVRADFELVKICRKQIDPQFEGKTQRLSKL